MRRRDFILGGAASFGGLMAPCACGYGQQRQLIRSAIVIGVDKPGSLPALSAAASGAQQIKDWLAAQGFEVRLFIDKQKPVEARDIKNATIDFVNRGNLDQLVVYFSGHGFLNNFTEYWLLSGAPNDPNEAVCLSESIFLARSSAIPSIIFISDACRSTPSSLGTSLVRGTVIFPYSAIASNVDTTIDQFLATHPGNPAFEVPVEKSLPAFEGIFTSVLLSAFESPTNDLVRTLDGVTYIPNRRLKLYLEREVPKRAQDKDIKLNQRPDAIIESDDDTYIGRVTTVSSKIPERAPATLGDVARTELHQAGADLSSNAAVVSVDELSIVSNRTGFDRTKGLIARSQLEPSNLKSSTGIAVRGASLAKLLLNSRFQGKVLDDGDGKDRPASAQVTLGSEPAASIALQFADGTGTVLAVLRNFVASVVVQDGKVIAVNYIPAQDGARWPEYQSEIDRLNELRTVIATSAVFGQFRIEGDEKTRSQVAEQLADRIRVLKNLDPTLGIYAAYAYAEAGLMTKVQSVRDFMRGDLGLDLFDLALLAKSNSEARASLSGVMPICPMLAQGWNLLRAKGVQLSHPLEEARDHLLDALWVTFDKDGMTIIRRLLEQ